jgi:putative flippase GtrA
LLQRLLTRRAAVLLGRNTLVSVLVFSVGLTVMWLLVERWAVGKLLAAGLSFLVANSIHYTFGHAWIYRGTERGLGKGYAYFLGNALVGLVITLAGFSLFLAMGAHYLLARVIASVFAGLAMFALNAILNFRCL